MCADHGVVEEGVSQTDRSVTVNVANAVAGGSSTINVMADAAGADVFAVDMGIAAGRECIDGRVIDMKVKPGTGNIAEGPAMTREEACRAVLSGMDMAAMLAERGYDIAVSGEMGIGNTTPMTAITCALAGVEPSEITGRGAGLSDEGLERKIRAVERALRVNCPDPADAVDVLSKVGGLEIAGMTGLFLGGAASGMPVAVDVSVSSAGSRYRCDDMSGCIGIHDNVMCRKGAGSSSSRRHAWKKACNRCRHGPRRRNISSHAVSTAGHGAQRVQ